MRSVLPERRHVNGRTLIEGAIEDAHDRLIAQIGQEIGMRLWAAAPMAAGGRRSSHRRRTAWDGCRRTSWPPSMPGM